MKKCKSILRKLVMGLFIFMILFFVLNHTIRYYKGKQLHHYTRVNTENVEYIQYNGKKYYEIPFANRFCDIDKEIGYLDGENEGIISSIFYWLTGLWYVYSVKQDVNNNFILAGGINTELYGTKDVYEYAEKTIKYDLKDDITGVKIENGKERIYFNNDEVVELFQEMIKLDDKEMIEIDNELEYCLFSISQKGLPLFHMIGYLYYIENQIYYVPFVDSENQDMSNAEGVLVSKDLQKRINQEIDR